MWEPATDIEQQMREALRAGAREEYFRLLSRQELLLPVSGDGISTPGSSGSWATWSTQDRTHVLAFTSEFALRACLRIHAGPYRSVRFTVLADGWPDDEWWLAVNPGLPIEGYLPAWFVGQIAAGNTSLPDQGMEPTSHESGAGVPVDDPAWPQSGLSAAPTASSGSTWGDSPGLESGSLWGSPPPAPPPTTPTGPGGLPSRAAHQSQSESSSTSDMPRREPASQGFGGSSGFGSDMPRREPASQDFGGSSGVPAASSAEPPPLTRSVGLTESEVEDRLAHAASVGDTETFLGVLMQAWAYLPVAEGSPQSARPGDPGFRWYTDLIDGAYSATAFTTQVRLAARYGDRPFIRTTFARVAEHWPGLEYSLYVNPGTEVGANMPGPQVETLVTWAQTKGLIEAAYAMEDREAPPAPAAAPTPEPEVVAPQMMQKVLPHHQVSLVLERGYDRVGGFVHLLDDVQGLITPHQLYWALGLLRDGGGFSSADESVHVLRWMGHRTELYRQAFGGNDPGSARSVQGGWVVEAEPFRGDGYAPDPDGRRIAEYKVDSVRLPHGAALWRIFADGSSVEVAVYDADRREWMTSSGRSDGDSYENAYRQEQQHA